MTASLPMYWRAENAAAFRRFWARVQLHADVPDLTPPEDLPADWYAHWGAPDLALSQACGLPFRDRLRGRVRYVASFDYALGCAPGYYLSHMVVHSDRPEGFQPRSLAFNSADSQSGWASVQDRGSFDRFQETGAHALSAQAVLNGAADAAYIDAVTWRLLCRYSDLGDRLRIAGQGPATPSLPIITALGRDPAPLRAALQAALDLTPDEDRAAMGGVTGLTVLDPSEYYAVETPPPPPNAA